MFFDFAFQLTAFEMRTKRDAMLQRQFKIACPCRKSYFKEVRGNLQEDDECAAIFFGSITAFMSHLRNHKCAIHHGLHCYLFELFKPVCRHVNVYADLVCIKKDEYVIISECIFLSLLRYVLIFNFLQAKEQLK